jgi:hypothetical protein
MKIIVAAAKGLLAIALTFIAIDAAKAGPATEVAAMGGVITAIVTVEAIDVPNRLLTVVSPEGNVLVISLAPTCSISRRSRSERRSLSATPRRW